jgi:nucleoside-diphosphate-sugar epimerase
MIGAEDLILITGATGFIGSRVVENLVDRGFRNLRCFARPSSPPARIEALAGFRGDGVRLEVFRGNLLSAADCNAAAQDATLVIHLAASTGEKSFPDAYMNSVVTTRNLLDACLRHRCLRRFVGVSSFTVYANTQKQRLLDETCPTETHPEVRGEAYCFAKVKQEELIAEYGREFGVPYVILRPGQVYGPGKEGVGGRVGVGTFGLFLHLGGSNRIPLTYVDNCAEAVVLAGLTPGVDGEAFNVVDDDLPSSRRFLSMYKRQVSRFPSLYVPHAVSYALCYLWERYSIRSGGQLPLAFNRSRWRASWRRTSYSNGKLKTRLGWAPTVSSAEGLRRFFEACRAKARNA